MEPLGRVLKELISELTSVSEVERYICSGCGNQVVVIEVPIIGGPNKGKLTRGKRGCKCWEYEQAREVKMEHRKLQIEYMIERYSTVNPELEKASFETYERLNPNLDNAYKVALEYVEGFSIERPANLLFSGMYGLGKSHLAHSVCMALKAKGFVAVFISVPKLLTIIKSTYRNDSDYTEAELLDVLSKVDFLALDDIGAEKVRKEEEGDSWATEKLFEIIDGRSGRHTLYTTNLTSDELRRKVGPRNFSRMMANTKPLKFEGDDYRIKNKRF